MRMAVIGAQHPHIISIAHEAASEPDIELVALAEPQDDLRETLSKELGVRGVADYRELLDAGSIDAAALAPINNEKGRIANACLEAGVHVLVDKPALTTLEDLARVEQTLEAGKAIFYCALTLRFAPPYILAKQAIERGEIGTVTSSMAQRPHKLGMLRRPDWFFSREQNGGVLLDLAIHDIDAVRWLHGAEPVSVSAAHGAARFTEHADFTDHAEAWLRLADGSSAFVKGSWLTPDGAPWHGDCRCFVEGTKGYLVIRTTAENSLLVNAGGETRTISDFEHQDAIDQTNTMRALLRDFVAVTEGRSDTVLTSEDVIESHRWALLARQAADSGELVRYP